jgi:hypothetical protein
MLSTSKTWGIEGGLILLIQRQFVEDTSLQIVQGPWATTGTTPSFWNAIPAKLKTKTPVPLESNLLNWSVRFQVFSKQSMHNQQVNMTVGVHLAQYHKLWLSRCPKIYSCMQAGRIPEDGHRLREWRLQSSQSRKLLGNLQTAEGWGLSTLESSTHFSWETGKPSKLATYQPYGFPRLFRLQKRHKTETHMTNLLYFPHYIGQQFSEAAWSSNTGSTITDVSSKEHSKPLRWSDFTMAGHTIFRALQ